MGVQHGELLKDVGGYDATIDYYPLLVERMLRGSQVGAVARSLPTLARPGVELALRIMEARRSSELRERSRVFSRSLGRPAEMSRYNAVMDVLQNLIGLAGQHPWGRIPRGVVAAAPPACSTLAIWGEGTAEGNLLHARNFDFPGADVWDRAPSVVFCAPRDGLRYGFVATRGADTPGVTAFNEAGLAITVHTRFHADVSFTGTTLVDAAHDIIRHAASLTEAVEIAEHTKWASTWGLLVSSAAERDAVLIEVTARGVAAVRPPSDQPFLVSTNRYRTAAFHAREIEPTPGWVWYSDGRFRTLSARAAQAVAQGGLDVADLRAVMGSHADPDVPDWQRAGGGVLAQPIGVQTVVVDAEHEAIEISVGSAPTGKGPYLRVPWTWKDAPTAQVVTPRIARLPHTDWQLTEVARSSPFDRGGEGAAAYRAFSDAARLEALGAPWSEIEGALERAAELDPTEPSYQLLAGGCRARRGDVSGALRAFELGLRTERSPFPRGRLLLWTSRAADALGKTARADAARRELSQIDHPTLVLYKREARSDEGRPWGRRSLRRLPVHAQLCDLG